MLCAVAVCFSATAQTDYVETWDPDADGDGLIGVSDLLALLGVFQEEDMDNDGIWDSQDDCVGAYDECGVCNGPGPQILGIDTIIVYYDSLYAEAIDEWWVFEVDADTLLTYLCENPGCMDPTADNYDPYAIEEDNSCEWADGSPVCDFQNTYTFDGYTYELVAIGDQCWFAENLRTEHYANGDVIPGELSNSEWSNADDTNLGAQAVCNNDASNLADYGRLYNWYAVDDARSLCTSGWHVPTDGEYMILEMALGMSESEANSTGWRGSIAAVGSQLKSSPSDDPSWDGTNTSGFSALAGGYRNNYGNFYLEGHGYFWSSSPDGTGAWYRDLYSGSTGVARYGNARRHGFSVRCVRDSESLALSGCTDETASNYDPEAVMDDGSCAYGPLECGGASTVTFDGYTYDLVAIGDQCWFAENLRNEHYTNGDAIPANLTDIEWWTTASGAVAVYGEDAGCDGFSPDGDACDPSWSLNEYGRLYNWYAVDDERGLCPTGWHVPTDGEFMTLEMELGMSESEATSLGWRGTDQGTQMKTTYGWYDGGNGTNSSGFSGFPGGLRETSGYFYAAGFDGFWWSSSPSGSYGWYRYLTSDHSNVSRSNDLLRYGFSVRCLKDAE